MFINPFIASLIPFLVSIFLIELTKKHRMTNSFVNFIIIFSALVLSLVLTSEISLNSQLSGEYFFYFWGGYLIFCVFIRKSTNRKTSDD